MELEELGSMWGSIGCVAIEGRAVEAVVVVVEERVADVVELRAEVEDEDE